MTEIKGIIAAMQTAMHEDGSINEAELRRQINRQIDAGVDAVFCLGTNGEFYIMSAEEKIRVMEIFVDEVKGRVPVYAGTGCISTEETVALSRKAQELGADALLQVTPYYNKASQEGLVRHFTQVADHVGIPILLYNVSSRTGVTIQPETYKILSEHPNIRGTKEAGGNLSLIARTAALCGEGFDIYSGNDDQIVPILSLGGIGVISVLSNVAPAQTHEICQKFFDGDVAGSRQMQLDAMDLCNALFCEVNPIPVKTALNMMGMGAGAFRMPLCEMDEANAKRLEKALKDYGIL